MKNLKEKSLTLPSSSETANVMSKGLSVFEDANKFNRWLQKENKALMGKTPISMLGTPIGIKTVMQLLGRIEEGVYT